MILKKVLIKSVLLVYIILFWILQRLNKHPSSSPDITVQYSNRNNSLSFWLTTYASTRIERKTGIIDVTEKFCPRGLVVDPFTGMFSTAKACIIFPRQRRLIGSDIEPLCISTELPGIVETYARQCLSIESDITGSDENVAVSKKIIKDADVINVSRKLDA